MGNYDIVLYGGYGLGNFGDDILMVSFINLIREVAPYASTAISAVSSNSDYLSNFTKGIDVIDRNLTAPVNCSVLIYGGGTQWYSFPNTTEVSIDKEFGLRMLIGHAIETSMRVINRIPINSQLIMAKTQLALGIGIGPFLAGKEKITLRELKKCSYIGVRDPISLQWCNRHKLRQAYLRADICYAPKYWNPLAIKKGNSKNRQRIGIVPRDWPHTNEGAGYLTPLVQVGKELRKMGYDVQYLIFSKLREKQTMNYLDIENENYQVWDPHELSNIDDFLSEIAECDLIISARYHGIVAAAAMGIPAIAVEVEQKLSLVSQVLSPGCVLWNQPFLPEILLQQVEILLMENEIMADAMVASAHKQNLLASRLVDDTANLFQELLKQK